MTLEEVVKSKEQIIPDFARDAVQKAYNALKDLWGYYVCKGKPTFDDSFNENVVREGLGLPKRFKVVIVENDYPIRYCDVETYPRSYRLENYFKGLIKDGEHFRTFDEVYYLIPKEISGIMKSGYTLRALESNERGFFKGCELTYEEVIP